MAGALTKHIALVGFMGAGKSTLGREVAERLGRPFVDVDAEVEGVTGRSITQLFEEGEAFFRTKEAKVTVERLQTSPPAVLALGGGALGSSQVRDALRRARVHGACTGRAGRSLEPGSRRRPSAGAGRARVPSALHQARADVRRGGRRDDERGRRRRSRGRGGPRRGRLARAIGELAPGGDAALVSDARVAGIHGADAQVALGGRLVSVHELPEGEEAKTVDAVTALWRALRLDRTGVLVALGGGCTTDAAGFAAATYLRGIRWVAVPTTLVGQVDAAIGGKTAIDLAEGKNLVGAFHWPVCTVIDPTLLATLPERERREGLAEVVKTGLLMGESLWELPDAQLVRRAAAYKSSVCLQDPHDRGPRNVLNLGHTFAHALEAAAGYGDVTHGSAVALGLLAALRLSGLDTRPSRRPCAPSPCTSTATERGPRSSATRRPRTAACGSFCSMRPGKPVYGAERPEAEVRAALDELIAH